MGERGVEGDAPRCRHCGGSGKWHSGGLSAVPADCYFCNGTGVIAPAPMACHHCGKGPDADGDHSCPCPFTHSECLEHTLNPVTPRGEGS